MHYPIDLIRSQFPALSIADPAGQQPLLLDGPGGSQVPYQVLEAITHYLGKFNSNLGGFAYAGEQTQSTNHNARIAAANWLGANAEEIVFGLNSTSLMFQISRAVANTWTAGDNIIVSAIDHYSHVSSWQQAAQDHGVEVRILPLREDGQDLDYDQLAHLADNRTKLIAYSLASNVLGTLTDSQRMRIEAQRVGALLSIDAVHAAVHTKIDVHTLGCDFLFASAYKLGGPHLGIMFAKAERLQSLTPYKVKPATEMIPNRWEQGTQSFEAQAGLIAMLDYWKKLPTLAGLATDQNDASLKTAYQLVEQHEYALNELILKEIAARPYITLYGKPQAHGRTPTFAFNIKTPQGILSPQEVSRWFGKHNIALGGGNFYALGVVEHFGITETGFLRMGCLHYNTQEEIKRFFELLDECVHAALT